MRSGLSYHYIKIMSVFASTLALVFVAELPGKTTFVNLLLAARGRPAAVFSGAAVAFTLHSAFAVAAGRLLSDLPARPLQLGVAILFLILAAVIWREKDRDVEAGAPSAAKAFGLTFAAQWGDPSQLATAALAAKYDAPAAV